MNSRICLTFVFFTLASGCSDNGNAPIATTVVAAASAKPILATVSTPLLPVVETDMKIETDTFGETADGKEIERYTLTNSSGMIVELINYGATVLSIKTPDKDGKLANIVLGHSSVENWLENPCYFNCTVGRYGNRIRQGAFSLEGNVYSLATNNGENHLHGGDRGFHKYLWSAEGSTDESSARVVFTRTSPDGEEGYPGTLETTVTYILTEDNELRIDYEATTDKPTVVNLTNHCYWNLTGDAKTNDILGHELTLNCNLYLPVDEGMIPTGDMLAVAETPMNFYVTHTIGERIDKVEGGYDHCYIINRENDGLVQAARVVEPQSGRTMQIFTTEPGIQFYSGNFLSGKDDNGGFGKHHGFCLETQHYPDSPNQPTFPSTRLNAGETYKSTTVHQFGVFRAPEVKEEAENTDEPKQDDKK